MMNEQKLNEIYQKMAQTINEMIPEEWTKVLMYGENNEYVNTAWFYYYSKDNESPIYSNSIVEFFDMEEEEYDKKWYELLGHLEELWHEFKNNGQEVWTNLIFIFDNQGGFKIEYDYEDLSEASDYDRKIIWKYKYLGILPNEDDAYDQRVLTEYLQSLKDEQEGGAGGN